MGVYLTIRNINVACEREKTNIKYAVYSKTICKIYIPLCHLNTYSAGQGGAIHPAVLEN